MAQMRKEGEEDCRVETADILPLGGSRVAARPI